MKRFAGEINWPELPCPGTLRMEIGDPPVPWPTPAVQAQPAFPTTLVVNFSLLVALCACACYWMWRSTDWLPVVGSLLALSGAFSWIALIARLVPRDRSDAMFIGIQRVFAEDWRVSATLLIAAAGLLVLSLFVATVDLRSVGDLSPLAITLSPMDSFEQRPERQRVTPGDTYRRVIWRNPISQPKYLLQVSGYCPRVIQCGLWSVGDFESPYSLVRPIRLAPSPQLRQLYMNRDDVKLNVERIDNDPGTPALLFTVFPFRGDDVEFTTALGPIGQGKRAMTDQDELLAGKRLRVRVFVGDVERVSHTFDIKPASPGAQYQVEAIDAK